MRIINENIFDKKDTPVNERSNWGQFGPLKSPQNVFSKFLTCSNPELSWLLTGGWRERCCGVKLAAWGNMWRVIWDGKRDADGGGVMWLWGPWPEENGDCMRGSIPWRGWKNFSWVIIEWWVVDPKFSISNFFESQIFNPKILNPKFLILKF